MTPFESVLPEEGEYLAELTERIPLSEPESATYIISVDENGLKEILLKLKSSEDHIADLAAKLGVSAQYLGSVLSGDKEGGPKLWKGMGVVRTYRVFEIEVIIDEQRSSQED